MIYLILVVFTIAVLGAAVLVASTGRDLIIEGRPRVGWFLRGLALGLVILTGLTDYWVLVG